MDEETKSQEPSEEISKGAVTPELREQAGTAPIRGRRASFSAIRRQLEEADLKSPAVSKLLLDMLEEAETCRDEYKSYIDAFHAADKRASVLGEKLNRDRSVEVFFGVGVGLGGAIVGLSPFFWAKSSGYGFICLVVGFALIIGASIGRVIKK